MNKTWLVAAHEYRRHVFTKRFVFALLSVPLFILIIAGLVYYIVDRENQTSTVGYVDRSGLLADPLPAPDLEPGDEAITIIPYNDQADAEAALEQGDIQAIFSIPQDYLSSGSLTIYHLESVKSEGKRQF